MRNLKRALSLVMAMALIVGMMVVSASAASKDFTDSDEIRHTEAVNTMVALNVISGKEDGSYFDPDGTLTRAEMAKIVAYVMNGGVEPNIGTKLVPTYSDIDNHWAEAYIEYCTSMGIIAGDGQGKFNPNGTLTASQTAKMFLTAIGYNAQVFGLLGNDWETNTNRYANEAGLYEDLGDVSVSAPISRDDAAQMAYNAIQATLMVRTWSQNQTTGQITEGYALDDSNPPETLFSSKFGGERSVYTFNGDHNINSTLKEGQILLGNSTIVTYTMNNGNEWIGEKVEVLWKDNTVRGTRNALDKEDTIYGIYPNGETSVLNVTSDAITAEKAGKENGKIEIDGLEYEVIKPAANTDVLVETNFYGETPAGGTDTDDAERVFGALSQQNGDTVKFILNDENKVEKAYVQTYKLGTVTAINSEKVTIRGLGAISIADNDVYEGIARNDVVVYSQLYNSKLDEAYVVVTKAESVSGTVNGYKTTESVTLDGTVYDLYWTGGAAKLESNVGGETGETSFTTGDIGEEFTLYLVNGYVAGAVQTSEGANNYSLVVDVNGGTAGDNWSPLKIVVLGADNVKTTLTVDKDSKITDAGNDGLKKGDIEIGDIVTWSGSADEALVSIEADWTSSTTIANSIYNDTNKTYAGVVTDPNAVLFVKTSAGTTNASLTGSATYKAYSIRSLRDIVWDDAGDARRYSSVVDDGKVVAGFLNLAASPAGATTSAVYGIVSADNGTVEFDDVEYEQFVVTCGDEDYMVNIKSAGANTKVAKGNIVGFAPSTDNLYDNDTPFTLLSAAALYTDKDDTVDSTSYTISTVYVKDYDEADGLLTYYTAVQAKDKDGNNTSTPADIAYYVGAGSTVTKAVADDVNIVYVDVDGDTAGDEIGVNPFDDATGYANVIILEDTDGVIAHIIVETSGEGDVFAQNA